MAPEFNKKYNDNVLNIHLRTNYYYKIENVKYVWYHEEFPNKFHEYYYITKDNKAYVYYYTNIKQIIRVSNNILILLTLDGNMKFNNITINSNIKKISYDYYHFHALTTNGDLLNYIKIAENIIDIKSSKNNTLILDNQNQLFHIDS